MGASSYCFRIGLRSVLARKKGFPLGELSRDGEGEVLYNGGVLQKLITSDPSTAFSGIMFTYINLIK